VKLESNDDDTAPIVITDAISGRATEVDFVVADPEASDGSAAVEARFWI
jgi:hypothetical protein